jgi:hypothetical protein
MLQEIQEAIAAGGLDGEKRFDFGIGRAEAGGKIHVAVVGSEGGIAVEPRAEAVDRGHVHGVVAFANIECAAIHLNAIDDRWNHDVGVGIAVAMCVCREIVRNQVCSNLKELRDRLSVVAGDAGSEILVGP